jgi:hypothetical protein
MSLSVGEKLEYRVANIAFHQEYFVRRRVSVSALFYPDKVSVTDIDAFGIKFDSSLNRYTSIWECRTGDEKSINDVIWLLGMSRYLRSSSQTIVKPVISDRIKAFAQSVGIAAWDQNVLSIQEKAFGGRYRGPHDYSEFYKKNIERYNIIQSAPYLKRVYWFQNSGFWFETSDARIKKILTSLRYCMEELAGLQTVVSEAAKELMMEGLILTSVALLDFASSLYPWQQEKLKERVSLNLSAGLGSHEERREIIEAALNYAAAMKGIKLPKTTDALIEIPPPEYLNPLLDNLQRIYEHPNIAIQVPRFLDLVTYDYMLRAKDIDKNELDSFFGIDLILLAKMAKNVVTFLDKAIEFPKEIVDPLMKI